MGGFLLGSKKKSLAILRKQSSACIAAWDAAGTIIKVELVNVLAVIVPKSGGQTGSNSPDKTNTGTSLTTGSYISLFAISGRQTSQSFVLYPRLKETKSG